MILFYGNGRLGNQIFQYAFISAIRRKNEILFLFNFESFFECFNIDRKNIHIIKKNKITKYLLNPLLTYLSKFRIISNIVQDVDQSGIDLPSYKEHKGLFNIRAIILNKGYFQSEAFFKQNIIYSLKINNKYLSKAISLIQTAPKDATKIFVHIRRGDYLNISCLGIQGINLPISYYWDSINFFIKKYSNPYFFFISDDPKFAEETFKHIKNKYISTNNLYVDFAIMTLCDSAIISNSSFSWWGAYLMNTRNIVFAPKYWMGFKSKVEFPKGIETKEYRFVSID